MIQRGEVEKNQDRDSVSLYTKRKQNLELKWKLKKKDKGTEFKVEAKNGKG